MWLDSQLLPTVPINNIIIRAELRGRLDAAKLARAWTATVMGRDAMGWGVDQHEPIQREVTPNTSLPIVEMESPAQMAAWIAEHSTILSTPTRSWEAALLKLSEERHLLFVRLDHLLTDFASVSLLLTELNERSEGREPIPAPGFREYLTEEASYQNSRAAAEDEAYWQDRLRNRPPEVRLYGKARRDRSFHLEATWSTWSEESTQALRRVAHDAPFRCETPTLSRLSVLTTALAALLYRAGGQQEFLIGIPIDNRAEPFIRSYGLFMEQIFVLAQIEEGETLASLGAKIRSQLVEGLAHGRACLPLRNLNYTGLSLSPPWPARLAGVEAEIDVSPAVSIPGVKIDAQGDGRDTFGMRVFDFDRSPLRLAFDHHAATFDVVTRKRTAAHYVRILEQMVADSSKRIDEIALLGEEERRQVVMLGRGHAPEGSPSDLLDKLESHTQASPDSVAVAAPEGTLRYRELSRLVAGLAARLHAMGVRRESRVGVALPRGARELVTFLATLKAGGCYVPLDPDHPADRVEAIVEDAAPELIVTTSDCRLAKALAAKSQLFILDGLESIAAEPVEQFEPAAPDQLAYILFTSGSTGRPKGVEITRGALANFLRSMEREPGFSRRDRILAITTTTFDIAGLELYLPLWVGGTVVIAERETAIDSRQLRARLEKEEITTLQATPATWRLLLDAGFEPKAGFRMFCGGERMSPELAERLLVGGGELWNLYGPTETTIWSTVERVLPHSPITIGHPIDHTQVYVLDPAGNLAPPGVVGEIAIGGRGVARGYRQRPDLTRERFIPDPFEKGGRIYKTGDLGRLLDDGRFDCLGRFDHQVKIRGYRIELGEIETALKNVPGVREVLVAAVVDADGEDALCAYWVGDATREALQKAARRHLPASILPTAYVPLESFPLNTNGKIDRKALPKPERGSVESGSGTLPRSEAEERVAGIWSDLLGIGLPPVDVDFFSLGGTSLSAVEVLTRMEEVFGTKVSLRAFFQNPTVESLASQIGTAQPEGPIVVSLRKAPPVLPPLHCLLGIALYRQLALSLETNREVVGLHVPMRSSMAPTGIPSVPELARLYVQAIREHQPHGPYHLLGFCFGGVVAFETARQIEMQGEEVGLVVVLDAILPKGGRFDYVARVKHLAKTAVTSNPRKTIRSGLRIVGGLLRRLEGKLNTKSEPLDDRGDWDLDGPDSDAAVVEYQHQMAALKRAGLLICRSDGSYWPQWLKVSPDLGWSSYTSELIVEQINASHRAMMDLPAVIELARAVDGALAKADARLAGAKRASV